MLNKHQLIKKEEQTKTLFKSAISHTEKNTQITEINARVITNRNELNKKKHKLIGQMIIMIQRIYK